MAFLITWVTHRSWLPGDPRGFRSHKGKNRIPPPERYADGESESYDPKMFERLYQFHSQPDAVNLNKTQRETVAETVANTIREFCPGHSALCVGEKHVHVLVELGGRVTAGRFCNYAKGRSARKLIAQGHEGKVWARRFHARHIDSSHWDVVKKYVLNHKQGEVIRETNG